MDDVAPAPRRFVHRFARAPVLDAAKNPRVVTIKDLSRAHVGILEVLGSREHPVLSASHIAALLGKDYNYTTECLKLLRSPGNDYVEIVELQREHPNRFRTTNLYMQLAPKGVAALYERCDIRFKLPDKPIEWLEHKTAESETMASFKIGAVQHPDVFEYVGRERFLENKRVPQKTREALSPETLFLPGRDSEGKRKRMRPDGTFFVLNFLQHDDFVFFPGIELETGKNPHDRLRTKLTNYLSFLEHNVSEEHFGIPTRSTFIPFVFASKLKRELAMEDWETITANKRRFRANMLFIDTITYETGRPVGNDAMVSKDWLRVERPPVNLLRHEF